MFALLALVTFILALFHVHIGSVDLVVLGLMFIAAHLLWDPFAMPWRRPPR